MVSKNVTKKYARCLISMAKSAILRVKQPNEVFYEILGAKTCLLFSRNDRWALVSVGERLLQEEKVHCVNIIGSFHIN